MWSGLHAEGTPWTASAHASRRAPISFHRALPWRTAAGAGRCKAFEAHRCRNRRAAGQHGRRITALPWHGVTSHAVGTPPISSSEYEEVRPVIGG